MKKLGKKRTLKNNETIAAYECTPCVCGCRLGEDVTSDETGDYKGEGK